jgi:hypothetical protein
MHVLGNLGWRPTPPEVVADQERHPDQRSVMVGRPSEADGAQLGEVRVIDGVRRRDRSAGDQGGANRNGDGQPTG